MKTSSPAKTSTRALVLWVVLLSACGTWISGQLLKEHANLWGHVASQTNLFGRVCQAVASTGFDCAGATMSSWSQISIPLPRFSLESWVEIRPATIPVAFLGLAYFVFMGAWFACIGPSRPYGHRWQTLPLCVASAGVLASLFMIGLMARGLAPWCLWCLIAHAINLLIALSVWTLHRTSHSQSPSPDYRSLPVEKLARQVLTFREVAATLAFIMLIIGGLWTYRAERLAVHERMVRLHAYKNILKKLSCDSDFVLREYHAQPHNTALLAAHDSSTRSIGNRPFPVRTGPHAQLVVFTDYECQVCACPSRGVQRHAVTAFDGKLDVEVRHFPLSTDCNPYAGTNAHPNACDAAYAVEAARLQGGDKAFWRMHDLLYRNRGNLHKAIYADFASQLALNVRQFLSDLYSDEVQAAVAADIELAARLDVQAAPTLFLNGRLVAPLIQTPTFWQAAAREWLTEQGLSTIRTAGFQKSTQDDGDCLEEND